MKQPIETWPGPLRFVAGLIWPLGLLALFCLVASVERGVFNNGEWAQVQRKTIALFTACFTCIGGGVVADMAMHHIPCPWRRRS